MINSERTTTGAEKETDYKTNLSQETGARSTIVPDVMRETPVMLKRLENNLPFTSLLLSIIGYIVIAATGNLNSPGQYFGFIIFLSIIFIAYKCQTNGFKVKYEKREVIYLVIIVMLIIILLIQNYNTVDQSFKQLIGLISKQYNHSNIEQNGTTP